MCSSLIKTLSIAKPTNMEYSIDLENPKEKKKFIERTKRVVRSSKEYKDYIRFLKDNVDMDRCAFFSSVKQTQGSKISIEIHHAPFTLDDICRIVMNKQLDEGKPLSDLNIADEVMELHYNNMIGLIPLSKTLHEVVHNSNKLVIPLNLCYGNFKEFIDEYQDYIEDDIYTRLEKMVQETKELNNQSFDVLNPKYEYINVDGFELPQKIAVEESIVA